MHKIISPYHIGFIKGRSISDNILLTQELVHNINKSPNLGNVVIKLNMTKAYDRVD